MMQEPPMMEQPPMDGNDMGQMGMPMDDQGSMQQPMDNPYDANFDAGVEADEETDPKKYIQQLTGKLSQSLRKYNDDLGQPDVDLNKYVAGMINKQATEGLSQDDIDEILNKIKSDEPIEDVGMEQGEMQEPSMQNQMPDAKMQQAPQQTESKRRSNFQKIEELTNNILNGKKEEEPQQKANKSGGFRKKPFTSPTF